MYFQYKHTTSLCLTFAVIIFVKCHCDKKSQIANKNITEL